MHKDRRLKRRPDFEALRLKQILNEDEIEYPEKIVGAPGSSVWIPKRFRVLDTDESTLQFIRAVASQS